MAIGKQAARATAVLQVLALAVWLTGCPWLGGRSEVPADSQHLIRRALFEEQLDRRSELNGGVPDSSSAHFAFMLGELSLNNEEPKQALQYFEEAAKYETAAAPTLRRRLAQLYLREKRLDDALEQLEIILSADPEEAEALQLKAGVLATLQRSEEAIEAYRKLISLGGKSEEPYIFAASLYLREGKLEPAQALLEQLLNDNEQSFFGNYYLARIAEAKSEFDLAEKYFERALEISPRADSVRLELARLYGAQSRFEEAIKITEELVSRNPKNIDARSLRAQLLLGKNDVDQALDEFEAVSKLEEDPSKTRFRIALIKLQQKDFNGAVMELNLILADEPNNSAARYYLASAYAGLQRVNDAISQIKEIRPENEYFVGSRTLGAFLLQRRDRHAEAIDLLQDVVQETPEDVKLLAFLSSLQRDSGDLEGAIATTGRLIELEPENDRHYFSLGVFQDELKNRSGAIEAMRKAIAVNPQNANALNYLGYTLAEMGTELKEAESLVQRALEIDPDNGYYIDSLGWIYYKMGRYQDARKHLERAAAVVPSDAVILEHLALVYKKLGQLKRAREIAGEAAEHAPESDDKAVAERLDKLLKELGVE